MDEYWVSHKRMDTNDTRIEQVKAMKRKKGGGLEDPVVYAREQAVNSIKDDNEWFTCEDTPKKWIRREKIHIMKVGDEEFIRTDKNQTPSDTPGELPDF